jgi:hypothetical protein
MMLNVQFPAMRRQAMYSLSILADAEYQVRVWIDHQLPPGVDLENLDLHINVLYDDTGVLRDPVGLVGAVLVEGDEVDRLTSLGQLLDELIAEHGDASDEVYLGDSRWEALTHRAALALAAMIRSGEW